MMEEKQVDNVTEVSDGDEKVFREQFEKHRKQMEKIVDDYLKHQSVIPPIKNWENILEKLFQKNRVKESLSVKLDMILDYAAEKYLSFCEQEGLDKDETFSLILKTLKAIESHIEKEKIAEQPKSTILELQMQEDDDVSRVIKIPIDERGEKLFIEAQSSQSALEEFQLYVGKQLRNNEIR